MNDENSIDRDSVAKELKSQAELYALMPFLSKFSKIHNRLKNDYSVLLALTEQYSPDSTEFKILCRNAIKGLFSIMEADIHYYNIFDQYPGYKDRDKFMTRFKKTFVQVCTTWKREELQQKYFSDNLEQLKKLKQVRDLLTHPKEIEHICDPTLQDFNEIKGAFYRYDQFVLDIMSNFFFSVNISIR